VLRPEPQRGDIVAAGAVGLATLVALVDVRFDERWDDAVLLATRRSARCWARSPPPSPPV